MIFKVKVEFTVTAKDVYTKRGVDKCLKDSAANFADQAMNDIEYHADFRKGIDEAVEGTIDTAKHSDFRVIIRESK